MHSYISPRTSFLTPPNTARPLIHFTDCKTGQLGRSWLHPRSACELRQAEADQPFIHQFSNSDSLQKLINSTVSLLISIPHLAHASMQMFGLCKPLMVQRNKHFKIPVSFISPQLYCYSQERKNEHIFHCQLSSPLPMDLQSSGACLL